MSAIEDLTTIGAAGLATRAVGAAASVTAPYDPSRDQEKIRGWVALLLVAALLVLVLTISVASLAAAQSCWSWPSQCPAVKGSMEALKLFIDGGLAAVVGLVGAVTGFYFGSKASNGRAS